MGTSQTIWPCSTERLSRRSRKWLPAPKAPPSKKPGNYYEASLEAPIQQGRWYTERVNERRFDKMRKELVSSFAEVLIDEDRDVQTLVAVDTSTLEQKFQEQSETWRRETSHLSSPLQKMSHPSYQAIMGMAGESPENKLQVIRLMLLDLFRDRSDWYLALSYLTQQNPIHQRDYGRPSKMAESWVNWGKSQGLL